MSMSLDQSLDDIVAAKKAGSRNNQRRRGPANRGGAAKGGEAPVQQQGQQQQPRGGRQPRQQQQQQQGAAQQLPALGGIVGDKVIVSNLPDDVNEAQVKELFTTTVGPTSSVFLAYNSKQKSTGVATVTFRKAADATKAFRDYNGRLIDGKRAMKVEIVVDPSRAPAAPLAARLGAAPQQPKVVSATVAAAGGSARQPRQAGTGGGRRGGRGTGGARSAPRPKATVESLDAEMSDWQATAGAGAAAPATTA